MEPGSIRGQEEQGIRDGSGIPNRASHSSERAAPASRSNPTGAREILVVDNDERIVELVSWFLSKRGYSVRSASNFGHARSLLAEQEVDLLLSDIDLGAESALDELPRMQSDGVLPPTLVFSGYLDAASRERLMSLAPVVGTLAKPVEFQVLESCVANYFAGKPMADGLSVEAGATTQWVPRPQDREPAAGRAATIEPGNSVSAAPRSTGAPAPSQGGDEWVEILPPQS